MPTPKSFSPATQKSCQSVGALYENASEKAESNAALLTGALFNIVALPSRVAYTLQAPLIGSAVDRMVQQRHLDGLLHDFYVIIGASTLGSLLGAMLIPAFAALFSRDAVAYETHGSFPVLLVHTLSLRTFIRISQHFRLPLPETVRNASRFRLPRSFLLLNIVVTSVYTIGFSATMYVSALAPDLARTATTLSGVINGAGSVVEVTQVVIWQIAGRFVGTLLAQLLFFSGSAGGGSNCASAGVIPAEV